MRFVRGCVTGLGVLAGLATAAVAVSEGALAAKTCRAGGPPVCGMRSDGPKSYDSACLAKADGATVTHTGSCLLLLCGSVGALGSQQMCGSDPLSHQRFTYPNSCAAEAAKAIWVHDGPCRNGR